MVRNDVRPTAIGLGQVSWPSPIHWSSSSIVRAFGAGAAAMPTCDRRHDFGPETKNMGASPGSSAVL
jgi:hypothetical protein